MDLGPLISAFVLILVTELGDKTMFAMITLSSRYSKLIVLLGALSALALVTAVGVLIGEVIFQIVPQFWLQIGAAALFLIFGIYTIVTHENHNAEEMRFQKWGGGIATFGMVALMELGDKSQLSVIALSAESGAAGMVFIGTMLAFAVISTIMVVLGDQIGKRVPEKYIRLGSGAIFILFGLIFVVQALIS
jgi:putative Ca2+/H+ antiporter (TMEM165/GDT1 family)